MLQTDSVAVQDKSIHNHCHIQSQITIENHQTYYPPEGSPTIPHVLAVILTFYLFGKCLLDVPIISIARLVWGPLVLIGFRQLGPAPFPPVAQSLIECTQYLPSGKLT